jgi:hypothetical protein
MSTVKEKPPAHFKHFAWLPVRMWECKPDKLMLELGECRRLYWHPTKQWAWLREVMCVRTINGDTLYREIEK